MDTKKLISLVKLYPQLYDTKHKQYAEVQMKDYIWGIIAEKLQEDVTVCKSKWKVLRSSYGRTLQKQKDTNKKWRYELDLSFLKDHVRDRANSSAMAKRSSTVKNCTPPDNGNSSTSSSTKSTQYVDPVLVEDAIDNLLNNISTTNGESVIKIEDNEGLIVLDDVSDDEEMSVSCVPTSKEDDNVTTSQDVKKIEKMEVDNEKKAYQEKSLPDNLATFFRAMAETLINLPPLVQAQVKSQIFQAVNDAEIKYLQERN